MNREYLFCKHFTCHLDFVWMHMILAEVDGFHVTFHDLGISYKGEK